MSKRVDYLGLGASLVSLGTWLGPATWNLGDEALYLDGEASKSQVPCAPRFILAFSVGKRLQLLACNSAYTGRAVSAWAF